MARLKRIRREDQATFFPQLAEKSSDRWAAAMQMILDAEAFAGETLRSDTRVKLCRVIRFIQERDKGKGCNAYVDTFVDFFASEYDGARQPIARRTVQKLLAIGRRLGLIESKIRPGSWCNWIDQRFAADLAALRSGTQNVRDTRPNVRDRAENVRDAAHGRRDVAHSVRDRTVKKGSKKESSSLTWSELVDLVGEAQAEAAAEQLPGFSLDWLQRKRFAGAPLPTALLDQIDQILSQGVP